MNTQRLREGKQRGWTEKALVPFLCSVDFHPLPGRSQSKTKYMEVEKDNLAILPGKKGAEGSPTPEPMEEEYPRRSFPAFL